MKFIKLKEELKATAKGLKELKHYSRTAESYDDRAVA